MNINWFEIQIKEQVTNEIIWDQQHGNTNERGQTLPRQGKKGENTRKCTSEPSKTHERVKTGFVFFNCTSLLMWFLVELVLTFPLSSFFLKNL